MELSLVNLGLAFGAGLASILSPCVLPVVPIIVTGTKEDSPWRPIAIVAGLSLAFVLMGVLGSIFGGVVLSKLVYVEKIAGALILVMGALMLANINPFKKLDLSKVQSSRPRDGLLGGFLLGGSLGLVWIPCVGPMLSSVLVVVATEGSLLAGILLLFIYSLGFAAPMLAVAYGSHWLRTRWFNLSRAPVALRVFSGAVLVLLGVWIIWKGAILVV